MARKLDTERIEKARLKKESKKRDIERRFIPDDFVCIKSGDSRLTVIEPRKIGSFDTVDRKLRVGAYVRVSTQEEAQIGSFENQIKHFTDEINENPTYEMVKIYQDEGISGTQVCKRKGFMEMLEDAKAGKLDLILTKSISRFGRNTADILTALQLLDTLSPPVPVIFETDRIDTGDGKNKIIISIMAVLSELESQLKSEAIKAGIAYKMKEGTYKFTVNNTLGFERSKHGYIKIVEEEAEIIRYIYNEFLDGASPEDIANALTESKISSPMGKPYWRKETVKSILSNEKYCGEVLYQKTYTTSYITHQSKKNNGILRQWHWTNRHKPIIQKTEWQKAQQLLEEHKWGRVTHRLSNVPKRFVISRVKSGKLSGFYLIDVAWGQEERERFLEILESEKRYSGL